MDFKKKSLPSSQLMPIEQALAYLLDELKVKAPIVTVNLTKALGCVLAEDQFANLDVPAHDNSAMDGFAINCDDLKGQETTLPISQTIAAGYVGDKLQRGTAARIFTGAPIPSGANAVVIQENTRFGNGEVTILEKTPLGKNIRLRGHDIAQGGLVLAKGHRLRPQDMGLLSSLGISKLGIFKPLTIAILNTGDEIVAPDQQLKPGQIYDSNSFTLDALLQKFGFKTLKMGIIADDLCSTEKALIEAAANADCIISTGGVSVGDEDHVKQAIENLGQLSLWKLAIKPGKPFSFGFVNDKPFFGLPGNPVAVFVTFAMLVKPSLLKIQGSHELELTQFQVKAGFAVSRAGTRQEYIRVQVRVNKQGEQELQTFNNQGSSIMTSLSWADGLAVIPIDCVVEKGDKLTYIPFTGLF